MKKCTPLGREAHVEVKMYKKPQLRSPSKSCDVEKVHAVVARSTFASEKAKNTSRSEHFWKLRCRKSARRCGVKHISKSKCTKYLSLGSLLKVEMFKKCTPLWREAHVEVKMHKTPHVHATFGRWSVGLCGGCKGFPTLPTVSKTWGFCGISKNDGGRGTCEEDLQRWISRGRRSTRDMFIRDVRRPGRWFPEGGCILEHQIFSLGKMILRDRCSTLHDLASLFRGRRSTLDRWSGKSQNTLVRGRQLCIQLSILEGRLAEFFRFWPCQVHWGRLAELLHFSPSNMEEVSQNCFVFHVVTVENGGSRAK